MQFLLSGPIAISEAAQRGQVNSRTARADSAALRPTARRCQVPRFSSSSRDDARRLLFCRDVACGPIGIPCRLGLQVPPSSASQIRTLCGQLPGQVIAPTTTAQGLFFSCRKSVRLAADSSCRPPRTAHCRARRTPLDHERNRFHEKRNAGECVAAGGVPDRDC